MAHSALYHLTHPDKLFTVLYIGRHKVPSVRLVEHRAGRCRQTAKCANRDGLDLSKIEMRVVRWFDDDTDPRAEGNEIERLQAAGQARWNFPHALSREENLRGARIGASRRNKLHGNPLAHISPENRRKNGSKGGHIGGPIGGRRRIELHGPIPATPEQKSRAGRLGGRRNIELHGSLFSHITQEDRRKNGSKGGRNANHNRWHVDRGIINPECPRYSCA